MQSAHHAGLFESGNNVGTIVTRKLAALPTMKAASFPGNNVGRIVIRGKSAPTISSDAFWSGVILNTQTCLECLAGGADSAAVQGSCHERARRQAGGKQCQDLQPAGGTTRHQHTPIKKENSQYNIVLKHAILQGPRWTQITTQGAP